MRKGLDGHILFCLLAGWQWLFLFPSSPWLILGLLPAPKCPRPPSTLPKGPTSGMSKAAAGLGQGKVKVGSQRLVAQFCLFGLPAEQAPFLSARRVSRQPHLKSVTARTWDLAVSLEKEELHGCADKDRSPELSSSSRHRGESGRKGFL